MRKDPLKDKLARTEALRSLPDGDELTAGLRAALSDKSNYVIAKAAGIAGSRYVPDVIPDLLAAYARLFTDPLRSDALALGKHAVAQALKDLDHRDPAAFLRGLHYEQFEPVYGGSADVAGSLRATCAHALVGCSIDAWDLLEQLLERLVDADKTVRAEVVRAIAQTGGRESALLLRLKARTGDPEPDVIGACFDALLAIEGAAAVAFIAHFLDAADDAGTTLEAYSALAASRVSDAFELVEGRWKMPLDDAIRRAIVVSCGASPLRAAGDFLVAVIAREPADLATAAIGALATSRLRRDLRAAAHAAARERADGVVWGAFERAFGADADD